ncbi:hypothetical protein R9C00_23065 [Flammeovirgaceae bacterium SG7u.111]|nr:hypothetical protein [Flammeovirgaceae bacterium SG7u.132]WPO34586.1 hypothetical protein R9C00_23065 [Flammeovirgaceae bacterium SG7u.111]
MASNLKKKLIKIGVGVLALIIVFFVIVYSISVSEGIRSGTVMKVSKKGIVFKTWEGQLNTGSIAQTGAAGTGVWEFSIPKDREDIFNELVEVSLSGERVKLVYKEKYAKFSWQGDTKYFVIDVEKIGEGK